MTTSASDARFVITPDDHAGLVVVVTAICLSWTFLVLIIRLISKLQLRAKLGLEEALVIIATCLATISSACILTAIAYGLGKKEADLDNEGIRKALRYTYFADVFYILAIAVSKSGGLPLIQNLTPVKAHILACRVLGGFIACWALVSFLLIVIRCHPTLPYLDSDSQQCSNLFSRWVAIESISIAIELAIFLLSISIVWIVKLKWQAKAKVLIAFATRLPVIIIIGFRLAYLKAALDGSDSTFGLTNAAIATQAVLHYTVMSASFAYLKPFLSVFDSNLGATVKFDATQSYNSSAESRHASVLNSANDPKDDVEMNVYSMTGSLRHTSVTSPIPGQFSSKRRSGVRDPYDIFYEEDARAQSPLQTTTARDMDTPSASFNRQERFSPGTRHSPCGSEEPIITKTQEWDIRTEPQAEPGHVHAM